MTSAPQPTSSLVRDVWYAVRPIAATILVVGVAGCTALIGIGLWQQDRAERKATMLQRMLRPGMTLTEVSSMIRGSGQLNRDSSDQAIAGSTAEVWVAAGPFGDGYSIRLRLDTDGRVLAIAPPQFVAD